MPLILQIEGDVSSANCTFAFVTNRMQRVLPKHTIGLENFIRFFLFRAQ